MSESTQFLILIDEDRRQFTVEGPLCDAQPWSGGVDKARADGRKVKCCDIGSTSRAEAIAEWQRHYGHFYRLVEPGRIVSPQSKQDIRRMKPNHGAQYEISIDGVPRTYRDRQDIALQTARFLKSRNPHSMVKLKDLQTGEETVVAFKSGQ